MRRSARRVSGWQFEFDARVDETGIDCLSRHIDEARFRGWGNGCTNFSDFAIANDEGGFFELPAGLHDNRGVLNRKNSAAVFKNTCLWFRTRALLGMGKPRENNEPNNGNKAPTRCRLLHFESFFQAKKPADIQRGFGKL